MQRLIHTTFALLSLAAPALCGGGDKLYSVSSADANIREVDAVKWTTASYVSMTATSYTISYANGLATHPTTGELYVLVTVTASSAARYLGKVNPTTGVVTMIGSTGDKFAGISFDAAGTLYAVTGDGGANAETLYKLSLTTGAATVVQPLGNGDAGESIVFDPNTGLMLHASGFSTPVFESVNLTSLVVTNIPLSGDLMTEVLSMSHLAGKNFLCVDLNDDVFVTNSSGLAKNVGTLDHSFVKGLAFAPPATGTEYYKLYGNGFPATSGHIPALIGAGRPKWGNAVTLGIYNGPGGVPAIICIGTNNLTLSLSPTCVLQNYPILNVTVALTLGGTLPGDGSAQLPLNIPPGAGLLDLYFQAVIVEPSPLKLVSSNPIQMHIQ